MEPFDPFLAELPAAARLVGVRSGTALDAAAVRAQVAARAASLGALKLGHGARIVVGETDPVAFIVAMLAAWRVGLAVVAVNPGLAAAEQKTVLDTTGALAWLGDLRTAAPATAPAGAASAEPLQPDEPALILMTSGTTGRPKGIAHSLRSLGARIEANIAEIGAGPLRQTLCVLPVFFGHGLIGNALTPLFAGASVHLWPTPTAAELPGLTPYLEAEGISFMSSVPSFWKLALRLAPPPQRPLERVHIGSAPLSIANWQAVSDWAGTPNVFNMFGMTETANWISGGRLAEAGPRDGYVGRVWGGAFAVLDEAGDILPSGRGEVLVRSPSIMLGYWERPDLDAAAFAGDWFRTGDTGQLEADGALTLVGRIKSEINRGGIKVQAEEVDMLLERHPAIAEACAFGIPDAAAGEAVAAAIVLKPGHAFEPEAIKAWCRTQARADAVPARLYALAAIPRNDRGKIVRADVRAAAEAAR